MPHLSARAALVVCALFAAGLVAAPAAGGQEGAGAQTGGRAVIRVTTPAEAAATAPAASASALEALLPAEASMVVLDTATGQRWQLRPERTRRPLPPCSTFKIPNTLISLGAGAVTVEDHFIARDPVRDPRREFWPDAWNRDHDLPSALRHSVVWYYQELARRVGAEEMQRQLDRLGYGNRDISAGIDIFWLGESLLISPEQQVDFLRRLHAGDFGFPAEHMALLREGLRQADHGSLHAKTGACPIADSELWVGWWVGWIERPEGPAFFALELTGPSYEDVAPRRLPAAKAVLAAMGLLPAAD